MGQTLTHGIYLPDEGERNCYNGLAANWSILDNSVGTVAEHTNQIAGKAPAVHTHTKADITDFPAYGTTAGTICEGNDSRLSDARTPVAHTHTKADITNLFNSANAWTNEQTCKSNNPKWINQNNNITMGVAPASNQTCAFYNYDKNGNEIGRLISRVQPNGKTITWVSATNLYKNGAIDPTGSSIWSSLYCAVDANGYPHVSTDCDLTPNVNNSYNLGSSSYQWNKIYSADVVHTSGDETITGIKTLTDYWRLQAKNLKAGEGEVYGRTGYSVIYTDKNAVTMGDVTLFKNANAARTFIRIRCGDYYTNGAPAAAGTLVQSVLMVGTNVSGKKIIECDSDIVYPTTNNATDLGTSTNKWKSLNGVNPGALSLPNGADNDASWIGDLTILDGSNNNEKTFLKDGWVSINIPGTAGNFILVNNGQGQIVSNVGTGAQLNCAVTFPVRANVRVYIIIKIQTGEQVKHAIWTGCAGNV